MNITDRVALLEQMLKENGEKLAISIPVATLEIMLDAHAENLKAMNRVEVYKRKYHQERSAARYYKGLHEKSKRLEVDMKYFDIGDSSLNMLKRSWTSEEEIILAAGKRLGHSAKAIAGMLEGRTEKAINTHWHEMLKKQLV